MSTCALKVFVLSILYVVIAQTVVNTHEFFLAEQFDNFLLKYNRSYANYEEHNHRFQVFKSNYFTMMQLNTENGANFGITEYMDITPEEFSRSHGWKPNLNAANCNGTPPVLSKVVAPDAFDWRDKGAVSPVKDQGQCGSCWAFATVGVIEGQWFLKHQQLISLAPQQLVDCDKSQDEGCNGGLEDNAYVYIKNIGGIEAESSYPYTARDGKCKFDKTKISASISSCAYLSKDETVIKDLLYQIGPLAVGINAGDMQFYNSGVDKPAKGKCNPKALDHSVLLIGYGTDGSTPYWTIKNSWGSRWGEKGFYRIIRGAGACGVNTYVTSVASK